MAILRRLKILVSAVQFRPGTPGNSENVGGNGDSEPSRFSEPSSVSTLTGTPAAQSAEVELGLRWGWFGPNDPPGVAADFSFLGDDLGGVVR